MYENKQNIYVLNSIFHKSRNKNDLPRVCVLLFTVSSPLETKHKHKVSQFYSMFVKKWNLGRILFIFIHSLTNSKSNELPQSLGCL